MQTPSKYQIVARDWLLDHRVSILADAPGVGKTLPAILAAKFYYGPKLVVVPAYLATNWAAELEANDETDITIVRGSVKDKTALVRKWTTWTIVSYEVFARKAYYDLLRQRVWAVVIYDEAHRLKGRDSKRTKAAYGFRDRSRNTFMLTGTPIVANGGDVFPLLRLCDPKTFSSYWRFVEDNCKVTPTPWAKKVGKPRNMEAFTNMLRPYMLRRTLESVLPDIPPVVHRDIIVEVDDSTRKACTLAKKEYLVEHPDGRRTRIGAGGLVSTVRSMVAEDGEKQAALLGLIEDIPESEQVVVFAWYRNTVDTILELIPSAIGFHGAAAEPDRGKIIQAFKDKDARILVASLSTMKEGVNLQNARHVIFYEESWVAATNEQATARLHRRGQEGTVLSYSIIARRTADQSVHKAAALRGEMSVENIFDEIMEEE